MLYYFFNANPYLKANTDLLTIREILDSQETEKVVMTIAEQLRQEGRQEGLQQGEIRLVSKQLRKKFGTSVEPYWSILSDLSLDELDLIGERIMSESNLEKIFDGFPKRVV